MRDKVTATSFSVCRHYDISQVDDAVIGNWSQRRSPRLNVIIIIIITGRLHPALCK